jgi:hypothetical protein
LLVVGRDKVGENTKQENFFRGTEKGEKKVWENNYQISI